MTKILITTMLLVLVSGCATTSDIENLQGQITVIQADQATLNKQILEMREDVNTANENSKQAKLAAERAEYFLNDISVKLTRFFKRSQYK